ncbi:death-associated protein 1-like isoform X1 [Ornithodoros turicata]|uniref:death-associated protein 1-like isoform X1 n=1 Tax=Ornithodoros turicata TaxID=34597 RepID=UPI003139355D
MSAVEESAELKAGHPPAVKVGGMRITQHKPAGAPHEKAQEQKREDGDEEIEEAPTVIPKPHLVISGVVARGDADFPTEAVQAYHNKPQASHEYRPAVNKPGIIHQPRK